MKIIARHPRPLRRLWLTLPPMVALATTSGLVAAREGNVFGLTLSESLQYDTNLLRVAPETNNRAAIGSDRRDDFVSSTTLALDMSKQVGRHTFYGELSRSYVLFQEFRRLNYTAENSRIGWSGVFGAENGWDTYFKRVSTQSDFADLRTNLSNIVTTDTLGANLTTRFARDWMFRPALYEETYSNSAVERRNNDGQALSTSLNVGYRPYSGNALEGQFRHTERDYDTGGGYRQNEIGALGVWVPGSSTTLDVRAALLQQRAKTGGVNGTASFHQVVGYINYKWRASGASLLNFKVFREISTINLGTDQDAVARGVTAQWTWAPLAKVKFDTIGDYRKRSFPQASVPDPAAPATRIGVRDRTHSVSFGAAYMPSSSWTLQASAKNERRHAEPSDRGYKDNLYSLVIQYGF